MDLSAAVWHKSSRSSDTGGMCVEVATNLPNIVAVRDSKNPNGPKLVFTRSAWKVFVDNLKTGRIDS